MAFDDAAIRDMMDRIASHAMTLGLFDTVNKHEPKSPPGNGLSCAVWIQSIRPVRSSGLSVTSGNVTFHVRIYGGMLTEPQDDIDPNMMSAATALMAAYSGDFDLGATVRSIDLLGMDRDPLFAQAGYLTISQKMFRVMVITLPVIVNDMFAQAG